MLISSCACCVEGGFTMLIFVTCLLKLKERFTMYISLCLWYTNSLLVCFVVVVSKQINVWRLFRNIHPSLQFTFSRVPMIYFLIFFKVHPALVFQYFNL